MTQPAKSEVSLKELILNIRAFINHIKGKWKSLLLYVVIGMVLGMVASLLSRPIYTASTSFILESTKKNSSSYAGIASKLGLSIGGGDGGDLFSDDDNMIMFLKSRTMMAQTLYSSSKFDGKEQLLIERYCESNDYPRLWKNTVLENLKFHVNPEERTVREDSMVSYFYKYISINNLNVSKPDKNQDMISVNMSYGDELFAKAFNEQMLKNVTMFYIEIQTKRAKENVDVLQYQADSVRSLLNDALSGAANSTDANPNPNPAFVRIRVPFQKKMVDVEMNKAILIELVKNLELAKISLRKETPLVQIIDKPILPLEKKKLKLLKGIVLGGFILGFLGFCYLALRYYLRKILDK